MMKKTIATLAGLLMAMALLVSPVLAEGTFAPLPMGPSFFPGAIDLSYDGSVVGGDWGGPFFYTDAEGLVYIDDGAHGYVSGGNISGDGSTLSLTFANPDGLNQAGCYNAVDGFMLIAPTADGSACDANLSSGYALDFDGTHSTGLQWIGCEARAFKSTMGGETVNLGSSGNSSRGTDISDDGMVVVGFDEHPSFGHRRAALWSDDVMGPQLIVSEEDASECLGVSSDGSKVCGTWNNMAFYWDDVVGPISIGTLPGDEAYGSLGVSISDDGKIVGFSGNPFFSTPRGFIWTPEDGLMLFVDYLVQEGVAIPEDLNVYSVTAVSGDGRTFVGAFVNADYFLEPFIVRLDGSVGNEIEVEYPEDTPVLATTLMGAYPNPFNPMTSVKFSLDREQNVQLFVYDMSGRLVTELVDQIYSAGEHSVVWQGRDSNGRSVSSGNYMLYMVTEDQTRTSKMALVR